MSARHCQRDLVDGFWKERRVDCPKIREDPYPRFAGDGAFERTRQFYRRLLNLYYEPGIGCPSCFAAGSIEIETGSMVPRTLHDDVDVIRSLIFIMQSTDLLHLRAPEEPMPGFPLDWRKGAGRTPLVPARKSVGVDVMQYW